MRHFIHFISDFTCFFKKTPKRKKDVYHHFKSLLIDRHLCASGWSTWLACIATKSIHRDVHLSRAQWQGVQVARGWRLHAPQVLTSSRRWEEFAQLQSSSTAFHQKESFFTSKHHLRMDKQAGIAQRIWDTPSFTGQCVWFLHSNELLTWNITQTLEVSKSLRQRHPMHWKRSLLVQVWYQVW